MELPAVLAAVSLVLALAALALAVALGRRVHRLTAVRGELARMAAEGDLARFAAVVDGRLDTLAHADERLRLEDAAIAERVSSAIRHVGVVRFDALPGSAGLMSFTLALLDDRADGMVLTSIYGRGDYRMYAKPVVSGASDHQLTDEETSAIAQAMCETAALPLDRRAAGA